MLFRSIKGKAKEGWRWKTITKTKYSSGTTEWYRCPLSYRCHCPCELSIYEDHHEVILKIRERHDENSHAEDHSKFLKTVQLAALRKQLLSNPVQAPSDVRVGVNNRSPEKFIPVELKRHVGRKVRRFRQEDSTVQLEGMDFDSRYGNLQNFAETKFFNTILDRYVFLHMYICDTDLFFSGTTRTPTPTTFHYSNRW